MLFTNRCIIANKKAAGANPRLFLFDKSRANLFDDLRLLLTFAAVVKSRQTSSQQNHGRWFGRRRRFGIEREDDAVIPEVAIGIKSEGDVSAIHEVCAQH